MGQRIQGTRRRDAFSPPRHEALEYCKWLTTKLRDWDNTPEPLATLLRDTKGQQWTVTLPSEAEWEKAARGLKGRRYSWGDTFDPNLVNCLDTEIAQTTAVGCFPGGATPEEGVEDLAGNVDEWTRSKYQTYPYRCDGGRDDLGGDEPRVLRGGSFDFNPRGVRCADRGGVNPGYRGRDIGFRVVVCSFRS